MSHKQVEDIYPLSPMQQGMLFHSLYAPDSGVYIIEMSFEIHGKLDVADFEQAWQVVIDKHPILRTAFVWEKVEKPLQVVGRKVKVPITLINWLSLEQYIQNQELEELLRNQRKKGFNLSKAPLMSLLLIHKQPRIYQFIWIYHHILLDGWSVPFVLQDVLNCYSAISKGEYLSIHKSPPYKDYIAWLLQQNLSEAKQFWRQNLAGFNAPTSFKVDKRVESSKILNFNHQEQQIKLSPETSTKLQEIARSHQLTINTLFQGAFALMLSRYSGENDIVFGVTSSGRPATLTNSESMVGLFINTLPMRVQVDAEESLLVWLQKIQKQQLELQQYEYSPLAEIQRWSDILRGLPLFESIIVFENYPVETAVKSAIKDLNLQNIHTTEQNNYPLGLYVVVDSILTLRILYDTYRFDTATITRMLGHLQTLLEGMVNDFEQVLSKLPLLTLKEQHQLLVEWNNTNYDYSNLCIHQLFEAQVEKTPDKIAVVFGSQQLTYQELNQKANQLAHYLQSIGITEETRVGICLERSEKIPIGLLGILKAGGTYIPLDPAFPKERLKFMLEDSQANFLVTESVKTYPNAVMDDSAIGKSLHNIIDLDTDWELITQGPIHNPTFQTHLERLAYIIYTSGSTGKPKGVQITHKSLVNCLESMQQKPGITLNDTLLSVTTLSFDIAALELYLPLITGARLAIASREIAIDGIRLGESLENNQITIMQATPASWKLLLATKWKGNQQLKILCGGEALDISVAQELIKRGKEVWNLYGPTEATIWSAVTEFTDVTSYIFTTTSVPIGKAINNTQFYVLDDYLQLVPIGVPGQLYIAGEGLAKGYLNKPELTADRFIPNPFLITGGVEETEDAEEVREEKRFSPQQINPFSSSSPAPSTPSASSTPHTLYKTGDRVRYLPDGNLEYLGRIDYQVKLRGFRIELGEIEASLMQYPHIEQAVVVLYKSQEYKNQDDERLIAYIAASKDLSQIEIRQFLQNKLPAYMLPSNYVMLKALPLTPNRKIDRKALPTPEETRLQLEVAYVQPKTEIEQAIAQIWKQVLQVEKVGIHDNFFDLGGHSLLMIKVHSQLKDKFKTNIPLVEMFRHPTISSLTSYFSNISDEINSQPNLSRNEQISAGKDRMRKRLQQRSRKNK